MNKQETTDIQQTSQTDLHQICIVWALPMVIMMFISLILSVNIASHFHGSLFVEGLTFILITLLFCGVYYLVFLVLPENLYIACSMMYKAIKSKVPSMKKGAEEIVVEESETKMPLLLEAPIVTEELQEDKEGMELMVAVVANEPVVAKEIEAPKEPAEEMVSVEPMESCQDVEPDNNEEDILLREQQLIRERREAFLRKQAEEHKKTVNDTLDYIYQLMPGIVPDEEVPILAMEISKWADSVSYQPTTLHTTPNAKKSDLHHFMWNVSRRLGKEHFKVETRAMFLRTLFRDMFGDNDLSTLKNLKTNPMIGSIIIDEPDEGSLAYHIERDLAAKEGAKRR